MQLYCTLSDSQVISQPGVPARSLSLSQRHSRSNKVYFGPLFLTQHFCPFYGWCAWCIQGHEGIEFMWIQRTTTTGKATPMNTCGSTCWQNKHVDPSERFLEKNRYNTTSQRLPQKTWIFQTSCSFLQKPRQALMERVLGCIWLSQRRAALLESNHVML